MKKLAEGGEDAGVIGRLGVELEGRSLLRDWDRNKVWSYSFSFHLYLELILLKIFKIP